MTEERIIYVCGNEKVPEGEQVMVRRIQVRHGVPLPLIGDRVVAMDEHRMVKFAGKVTAVDYENNTYDVELWKSFTAVSSLKKESVDHPKPPTGKPNVSAPPPPPDFRGRRVS